MFEEMDPVERIRAMSEQCYKSQANYSYTRKFIKEEIDRFRKQLAELLIEQRNIEDDKRAALDEFKQQLKPIHELIDNLIDNIKFGSCMITGTVFLFDDQRERKMYIYNEEGELVDSRPLSPDERQLRITETGTD